MPTWGEILNELKQVAASTHPQGPITPFDLVRRKYIDILAKHTGRNVILYASRWTQVGIVEPDLVSITPEDMEGFMEVIHGLSGDRLDLILHLPGGSAEAAESLVAYLRSRFSDIRILIPHAAMSAASMLACSANVLVMGKHSFLGPIDPQLLARTELGRAFVPAHAIVEQFTLAKEECKKDPAVLGAWVPILRQYGPALIVQCKLAQALGEELVSTWLAKFMFAGTPGADAKAASIASALGAHGTYKSHGRFISRDRAKALGLVIEDLEGDQILQDSVLSVFHATTHTFNATPAVKLIENQLGKAFVKRQVQQMVFMPQPPLLPPGPPPGGPP